MHQSLGSHSQRDTHSGPNDLGPQSPSLSHENHHPTSHACPPNSGLAPSAAPQLWELAFPALTVRAGGDVFHRQAGNQRCPRPPALFTSLQDPFPQCPQPSFLMHLLSSLSPPALFLLLRLSRSPPPAVLPLSLSPLPSCHRQPLFLSFCLCTYTYFILSPVSRVPPTSASHSILTKGNHC